MYKLLLYLIRVIHILLVIFIVCTPFLNINAYLLLHIIIVPFIILHWIMNNNTCALTVAEYYLREIITGKPVDRSKCFMSRLIDPVYDFKKNYQNKRVIIYGSAIGLFSISLYKLIKKKKTGEIKSWRDLFEK